jgi:hypothetical protein
MKVHWMTLMFFAMPALAAPPACPPTLPEDVCKLEEQLYLHTDFHQTGQVREVMVGLKNLLIAHHQGDESLREHILGLVDHVVEEAHAVRAPKSVLELATGQPLLFPMDRKLREWEKTHGAVVPLDWELPEGVRLLDLEIGKSYDPQTDRTEYEVGLWGGADAVGQVEDLRVTRYPDQPLLDKHKLGGWHESVMSEGTGDRKLVLFSLGAGDLEAPPREGLYLLDLKLAGQPPVKGWFILARTTPTSLPVVKSPSLGQAFSDARPRFRWLDFHSPQHRAFEHRKRIMSVRRLVDDSSAWRTIEINPPGQTSLASPVPLRAGEYVFNVSFAERWLTAGGFFIGRKSDIGIPYRVVR